MASHERVRIGEVAFDPLTFAEALDAIEALVAARRGGSVFTPNVDHVVKAERDAEFRAAYEAASLSLVDGMPLLWASRVLRTPLPEKVSGSDLVTPLIERAAARRWRIYLLAAPEVVEASAREIQRRFGAEVVGFDAPIIRLGPPENPESVAAVARVRAARPDLVLVGFGAPKQEIWINRHLEELRPAVAVGVGASLAFLAGLAQRAPRWMSRAGLEWLHRLAREPQRMWRRYLVDDVMILPILARTWARSMCSRPGP